MLGDVIGNILDGDDKFSHREILPNLRRKVYPNSCHQIKYIMGAHLRSNDAVSDNKDNKDKDASPAPDLLSAETSSGAASDENKPVTIEKVSAIPKKQADKKQKSRKKYNIWWIKAAVISLVLAAFFSFLSELTASAENIVIIILLLAFLITASILFDAIGVAVTSCDSTPIVSMASRKIYGARTALWLVKNSGTVSSVCNDVIGDIFGIISGACSAAIVLKITLTLGETWQKWLSIGISAVVSALTIGGKAFMKNIAISNSREFVMFVARCLAIFNKDERRIKKREAQKKKQQRESAKQGKDGSDDAK